MVLVVKNLPASAGDVRDLGLIPVSGRSPGEGNGNPLQSLAWRIPWTEEPDRVTKSQTGLKGLTAAPHQPRFKVLA